MNEFNNKPDLRYKLPFYIIGIVFIVVYVIGTYSNFSDYVSHGRTMNFSNIFFPYLLFLVIGLFILGYGKFRAKYNKNRKSIRFVKFILYCLAGIIIIDSFFLDYSGEFAGFAILVYWGIAIFLLIIAMIL